jgi:tetratricopeptide (TPR) repeat protein
MKNFIYISIFLVFLIQLYPVNAQGIADQKYKLAQSFEQNGDFHNSGRMYLELYNANKRKKEYLQGVIRTYSAANRFGDLLEILEGHLEIQERFDVLAIIGQLHWRLGSPKKADEAWVRALELGKESPGAYMLVGEAQTNIQLSDRAIKTYVRAREEFGDPMMFIDELSQLYLITGDYKNGTEEVFKLFDLDNDFGITQGRLSAMMQDSAADKYIAESLDRKLDEKPNNINLNKIKVWFLRSHGDQEEALELTKKVDELLRGKGREILRFGNDSQQDGQYDIAMKAYEIIIDMGSSNPYLASALYAYAKTLELKLADNPQLSKERVIEIIDRYEEIAKGNRNKTLEADAKIRMAALYFEYLDDDEKAIDLLTDVSKNYNRYKQSVEAVINLADIFIAREELGNARELLKYSNLVHNNKFPESYINNKYKLAQIEYFSGNIDTALALFKEVTKKPGSDEANDALQLVSILETNKQFTLGLQTFAKAEFAEFRKEPDEAIKLYRETETKSIGTPLAEIAIIRAAEIEQQIGKHQDCIETVKHLLELYPNSIYLDFSLILRARAYLAMGNSDAAMDAYTELITFHPNSIYLQEARKKIRELRDSKS